MKQAYDGNTLIFLLKILIMFFSQIYQIMTNGIDCTMVIRKIANGQVTVSILPRDNGLKDEAQNHIIPLTLSGTPSELDAGFFASICQPLQKTTGLISNLAVFEQQMDKASANSRAVKAQKEKEAKEAKERKEKYDKHLKKAEELIAAKRYTEALASFDEAKLCATDDAIKIVEEKAVAVRARISQGSLFEIAASPAQSSFPTASQPSLVQIHPQTYMPQPILPNSPQHLPEQSPMSSVSTKGHEQPLFWQNRPAPENVSIPDTPRQNYRQSFPQNEEKYSCPAIDSTFVETCRPDEYAAYPDFPDNMKTEMF